MNINLQDLKRLLGDCVPSEYIKLCESKKIKQGFDPKTVCILNLELRDSEANKWARDKFVITGDGCGNYYYAPKAYEGKKIYLWSHDPLAIEKYEINIADFIKNGVQENPIILSLTDHEFAISRTEILGESILDPISLDEWKNVIELDKNITYLGFREMINPFTKEITKMDCPGYSTASVGGKKYPIKLIYGRIISDAPISMLPSAKEITNQLKGKLFECSR
jgi:hypothetical protein